jgi:single-stranded-DNA-specific exonuclease
MPDKRWKLISPNIAYTQQLQKQLGISSTICAILVQRSILSFDAAKQFFRPQLSALHSPWLMKDMEKAVTRISKAIEKGEKIMVYGDYDVDGTTSVASMFQFLQKQYPNVIYYIPHRYKEGYGVSKKGIDTAFETGVSLIICLDCGIKSVELITYAQLLGIDFVICDHHLPDDVLPPAVAILNPKQIDCSYPFKDLCGCGVGFKLMMALAEKWQLPEESYLQYLDLVATAIAADIVSMWGENRILAFYGLQKVNTEPCKGIAALIKLSKVVKTLTITNLVFIIAPRINAAGRMDDAKKAVQLFLAENEAEALQLAEQLHDDNSDRKEADSSITEEALLLIEQSKELQGRKTTVLYQPHWHKGVVGIVASRLTERYYRPTIILTKSGDVVAGSARSVAGFDLYEAIHACKQYLLGYGGHFAAAGMTLLEEQVTAFSDAFERVVSEKITDEQLIPEIVVDADVQFSELTPGFYHILEQMEPFGPDNMKPVFWAKGVTDTGFSKIVKDAHIRFSVKQKEVIVQGIGFNMAHKFPIIEEKRPFDILFHLEMNEYNGEKNLQLKVIDIKAA